ncbi:MAG: ADP-ribosylglycohydrolase family protein [Armatimonadetes bacterium]|nr:ADP-ribosylglycohydrolase family protein [Armatimonadota bacterium]
MGSGSGINLPAAKRSLVGTLVGDSLGLPYEGLKAPRNTKLMPLPLRQRIFLGKGFASDDTLQSMFALQALVESDGDIERFTKSFSHQLRTWFLSVPPGIGLSTIKSCLRLCTGMHPTRTGVRSAGNGAAMRSAVLGAALCDDDIARIKFVDACCMVTHTDPLAVAGSQMIALAAALSARQEIHRFEELARGLYPDWPWTTPWPKTGPTGYVVHSVNASLHVWQSNYGKPEEAIQAAITLGGDTDSVAAMVGGILGADSRTEWPEEWLRFWGWPSLPDIENLSGRAPYLRLLTQHLGQLPVVLAYGFRRLGPPY